MREECEEISDRGRTEFDRPHSLTYRAAEAIVMHFQHVVITALPPDRLAAIADLPMAAVKRTRNIVAHNYLAADKAIIWMAVTADIPEAIRKIIDDGRL